MNEKEAMEYLEKMTSDKIELGLDSIKALLDKLGNPQKDLRFIHIAGTNGKGSVLAYISTVLKEAGYKVGRYISPTIFSYRERIQINERPITARFLGEGISKIKEAVDEIVLQGEKAPSVFEMETALGFLYFKEKKCDVVVIETGMGGLLDATNIISNTVLAVFTSISMDHMMYLGSTLTQIAQNKAGILKPGAGVVSIAQKQEVMDVIEKEAKRVGCSLVVAYADEASEIRYGLEKQTFSCAGYKKLQIRLAGKYQIENAILALTALKELGKMGFLVSEEAIRKGLQKTVWPARFQVIEKAPMFIVDGAHNPDAADRLAESIEYYLKGKRIIFILGVLRDKDYEAVIKRTISYADQVITVQTPRNNRALPAYELAKIVCNYMPYVTASDSLEEAVEMSYMMAGEKDVILAFGSLSFLGELTHLVAARKKAKRDTHFRLQNKENHRRS